MTRSYGGATIVTVEDRSATVTIKLDSAAGPISGLLASDDGSEREFSGWIQLAALIESQRPYLAAPPARGTSRVNRSSGSPGPPQAPRAT